LLQKTDRFPSSLSCVAALELSRHAEPTLWLTGGQVLVGVHDVMGQRVPGHPRPSSQRPACCPTKLSSP
jgi:hypothetical protein